MLHLYFAILYLNQINVTDTCDWTISTSSKKCQTRRSCACSFAYWSYKDHTLIYFKTRGTIVLFGCEALFTVRHFLLECDDFSHIRNKYFHVDTIKQLFNDVPTDNVFLFLKQINLFNKLWLHFYELFIFLLAFSIFIHSFQTKSMYSHLISLCSCQILYMIFPEKKIICRF